MQCISSVCSNCSATSLGEETPPLPVTQLQVCRAISLNDTNCIQLVTTLLEMSENTHHMNQ